MTVKDLVEELKKYDDNIQVVMNSTNSDYIDDINGISKREVVQFLSPHNSGRVCHMVVIMPDGQIGVMDEKLENEIV